MNSELTPGVLVVLRAVLGKDRFAINAACGIELNLYAAALSIYAFLCLFSFKSSFGSASKQDALNRSYLFRLDFLFLENNLIVLFRFFLISS